MSNYEIIEHTADKGLEVYADTLEDLFATAADGLLNLMIDPTQYPPTQQEQIELQGGDLEVLMVRWLNELLYRFEIHKHLFSRFEVLSVVPDEEECELKANVGYRVIKPEELEWNGAPVKSVTYHNLRLEQCPNGWFLRFYVDV